MEEDIGREIEVNETLVGVFVLVFFVSFARYAARTLTYALGDGPIIEERLRRYVASREA